MNLDCVASRFTEGGAGGGGSGSVGALLLADLQLQRFYTPLHLSQIVVKTLQQLFETWRDKSLIDLKASSAAFSVSSQSFCFFFVCVCVFVCGRGLQRLVLNDAVRLKVLKPDAVGLKIKRPN